MKYFKAVVIVSFAVESVDRGINLNLFSTHICEGATRMANSAWHRESLITTSFYWDWAG